MTLSVSLRVYPEHKQANSHSRPGAHVEQNGPPVEPILSFSLRVIQSLFHLLDLLGGAGNSLLAVSLSYTAKQEVSVDSQRRAMPCTETKTIQAKNTVVRVDKHHRIHS